jgi:hypothetical protein
MTNLEGRELGDVFGKEVGNKGGLKRDPRRGCDPFWICLSIYIYLFIYKFYPKISCISNFRYMSLMYVHVLIR